MANSTRSDETEVGAPTSPDAITARDLLFTTARVMRANVASFFLVAALCTLPAVLLALAGSELEASAPRGGHGWTGGVAGILYLLGLYVAQASIVFATVAHLARRNVAPHESLTAAYHRLVSILVSPDDEPLSSPAGYLATQGINFLFRTFVLVATATLTGVFYARARGIRDRIDARAIEEVFR